MSDFQSEKQALLNQCAKTPNNTEAMISLVRLYLQQGMLSEAKNLIEILFEHHPDSPELHNNLGVIFYRQELYQEASENFVRALKLKPDYFDAMYNLALVYQAQHNENEAMACLYAIVSANPDYLRAQLLLGKLFLEKKLYDKASESFQRVLKNNHEDVHLLENIIQCLLVYDRYHEARAYCERLLKLQPQCKEAHYNLGVIANRSHNISQAMSHYQAALTSDPYYFPALNNLAVLYLEQQNLSAAQFYFEQALKQQPDNQAIQYSLNAITGGNSFNDAPKTYIRTLFDSYAFHYEQHLTQGLEYVVPQTLKAIVLAQLKPNHPSWRVLDLGCGTGLCGVIFKPWAKELIGVDLSPRMLELAKQKTCYDQLIEAENVEYLAQFQNYFDLILAADVLIYQGDLTKIFKVSFDALTKGGALAFSTEINEDEGFSIQKSGRFCHSKPYILELTKKIGFSRASVETNDTRLQQHQTVQGYYFVLEKG